MSITKLQKIIEGLPEGDPVLVLMQEDQQNKSKILSLREQYVAIPKGEQSVEQELPNLPSKKIHLISLSRTTPSRKKSMLRLKFLLI